MTGNDNVQAQKSDDYDNDYDEFNVPLVGAFGMINIFKELNDDDG